MPMDGHIEGSLTRSGGRTLSLLDRVTPRSLTSPHHRFSYHRLPAPASSMLIDGHFETRSGGRTLSLLDRITPRVPRGSGLGHGAASGKNLSKRGRSCTKVFCTMTWDNC
jgi:hypothetical protein